MKCNKCGANLREGSKFCNLCGSSVSDSSDDSDVKKKKRPSNDGFTDVFVMPNSDESKAASESINNGVNKFGFSSMNLDSDNDSRDNDNYGNDNSFSGNNMSNSNSFNGGNMNYNNSNNFNNYNGNSNNGYNSNSNYNSNSSNSNFNNSGINNNFNNNGFDTNNINYNNNNNNFNNTSLSGNDNFNNNEFDFRNGNNFNNGTNNGFSGSNNSNVNSNFDTNNIANTNNNINTINSNGISMGANNMNNSNDTIMSYNINTNVNNPYNNSMMFGQVDNSTKEVNNINRVTNNNKNKQKKGLNLAIAVPVVVISLIVILYFMTNGFAFLLGKRTIMIYMIGSDLESTAAAATTDIYEMVESGVDLDKVNVLLYTGGTKKWNNNNIPDDKNAIFKLTSSGIEKLAEFDKSSMVDPNTLTEFLNYGYSEFRSAKYSLILWDHGGGPIFGYGQDEGYIGSLTLPKLKQAFDNSPFKNKKLEMIGFDACLMSSIEVASVLSNYAGYMVASQEVEPGYGWDYSFLGEVKKGTSTIDMGMAIVNHYGDFYKKKFNLKGITLSLLDLKEIAAVEKDLNDLFKDVDNNLTIDYSLVSRTRNSAKSFGRVSSNVSYDLVDLYDLINKLPNNYSVKASKVKSSLDSLVVYQTTDLANTYGVSIYFPFENKTNMGNIISLYQQFDFATEYTKFISNFSSKLTGTKISNWRLSGNVPTISDDKISVEVPEDVVKNYSSANYVIFEKLNDKYYMPRFKGTDVTVSDNVFSTTIEKKGIVASNAKEAVYLTAVESEKGKDYVKYLIPAILQNWGSKMSENFTNEAVYVEFVVDDKNPNGVITGAIPIVSETEGDLVAPKLSFELKDWKLVQFWNTSYKIFDDNGNYTTDWENSGSLSGIEFMIADGFNLEFKNLDSSKEYYALFHIYDSQGNRYTTNMVKVNV